MYLVQVHRRGKVYHYFRYKGLYRRLPDDRTSDDFKREYAKAFASTSLEAEKPLIPGSVRALIRDFKLAPEFRKLASKTQADYARVLDYLAPYGDFQAGNLRRQHVVLARNHVGKNTRTQDLFVQAVSRMFTIGMNLGYTDRNPAARIERLNDPKSYEPWMIEDHRRFRASNPPHWMMTAYMLGVWTAQREGDILRLARARYDGAGFTIRQGRPEAKRGKGRKGEVVRLHIVAAKPLRAYLAKCTFPGLLFVTDDAGKRSRPPNSAINFVSISTGLGLPSGTSTACVTRRRRRSPSSAARMPRSRPCLVTRPVRWRSATPRRQSRRASPAAPSRSWKKDGT
jgi:integrase